MDHDIGELPALQALLEWRQQMLDSQIPEEMLPTAADLRRIAAKPPRAGFKGLGLARPHAARRYATEILALAWSDQGQPVPGRTDPGRAGPGPIPEESPEGGFTPHALDAPAQAAITTRCALSVDEDGSLQIGWHDPGGDAGCCLYRVVTSEEGRPYSPDQADLVTVTAGTGVTDDRPFTGPVRYVQIWGNRGPSEADARRAQPELVAEGVAVSPPHGVTLSEDHGVVSGTWQTLPAGIERVEVQRVPEQEAARRRGYLPHCLIAELEPERLGFQDTGCEPGRTYEYRIFTVAVVDGNETMGMVSRRIHLAARLVQITDLRATSRREGNRTVVDLEWTTPHHNEVRIYRTQSPADAGSADRAIPEEALGAARLPDSARLTQAVRAEDGRGYLDRVAWPQDWPMVYFTPVCLEGGQARIGPSQVLTRVGAVRDVRLVQHVDWQLLTLDWPDGAAQVQVFVTPVGVPIDDVASPSAQLSRARYEAQGGLRLHGTLPAGGCDLHILPASFHSGQIVRGEDLTVTYGGLCRLWYRFTTEASGRGGFIFGRSHEVLQIQTDRQPPVALGLALVYHQQRLPLDGNDGHQILAAPAPPALGRWATVGRVHRKPGTGYFRLFAVPTAEVSTDLAVLDPPLGTLRGTP